MNKQDWEETWEGLLDIELAYWFSDRFTGDELESLPFSTFRELSEYEGFGDWFMTTYNTHRFNYYQMESLRKLAQKLFFIPKMADAALSGDWEEFSGRVHTVWEIMPEAFEFFYEDMPEQYRRDFVVGCYDHHGDTVADCCEALKELPKNGLNELPQEYAQQSEITVWRAGEEPIEEAPERLSWTLDEGRARWFLHDYIGRHAQRLYRAHIRPCDVIAYTNDRDESEVIQCGGVYDVEIIEELEGGAE